jgi:hypothetical protein
MTRNGSTTTRIGSIAPLTAVVALLAAALSLYFWLRPANYQFVEKNLGAFASVPVFPSGHVVGETSAPYFDGKGTFARVVGYTTTRRYALRGGTTGASLVGYYLYQLRTCRLTGHSDSFATFRCAKVDVSVDAASGRAVTGYSVTVYAR